MVVEHVLAGKALYSERAGHHEAPGASPDLRLVAAQPEQLRSQRLGGEGGTTAGKDGFGAITLGEFVCLGSSSGVDAVKDGRAQRFPLGPNRQEARPYSTDTQTLDRGQLLLGEAWWQGLHIAPPARLGIVLDPPRLGQGDPVGPFQRSEDCAVSPGQHGLRAGRPYVQAKEELIHLRPPSGSTSHGDAARTRISGACRACVPPGASAAANRPRSEERRVGKEW